MFTIPLSNSKDLKLVTVGYWRDTLYVRSLLLMPRNRDRNTHGRPLGRESKDVQTYRVRAELYI